MTIKNEDDRQELVDFLKGFGWTDEKANAFLNDKVGIVQLQIPGKCLPGVLESVCKEGIPTGTVVVNFMVPTGNRAAFQKAAEISVAKQGGFVFSPEEKARLAGFNPDTIN